VSERSTLRLVVLQVLVVSLLLTLGARLFYLQVVSGDSYKQAAQDNRVREIITPAVRGLIVDQMGRPLVANRTSLVVSVQRGTMVRPDPKDDQGTVPSKVGAAVLPRLAKALGISYRTLWDKLQLCGTKGAKKPPACWNGSPYQPIPVAKDITTDLALQIMEKRAEYPGVQAELEAVRQYPRPYGVNAAHLLGYLGPVNDAELAASKSSVGNGLTELRRTDLIGRSGLESQYDDALRGKPGVEQLAVDKSGTVSGTVGDTPSTPGSYLVTSLDARLQSVLEQQLVASINRAHKQGKAGTSASGVVVDTTNGQILAMASYPTYDPSVWVGGIGKKEYESLTSAASGYPLIARTTQGLFPPASTFKVVSTAAAAKSGLSLDGPYDCSSDIKIGNQTFANHESQSFGKISVSRALEVSCNTVFYGLAYKMWQDDGGSRASGAHQDAIEKAAAAFGLGARTKIDIPGEAVGRVGGRAFKQAYWDKYHDVWCQRKDDPTRRPYLRAIDADNCASGYVYRGGDAANLAIGQGDTVVTPLQMAMVYAAIANGGKLFQPHVAKAVVSSDGRHVTPIKPVVRGKLPMSAATLSYLRTALNGVTAHSGGTGNGAFSGFPLAQIPVAAKTGTGQVQGKDSDVWFDSYAPASKPRYAVVMTVQGGKSGAETVGPSVRKVYEALFGVSGSTVDPTRSILVGGAPNRRLPVVRSDGTVVYPEAAHGKPPTSSASAMPSPKASPSGSAASSPSSSPSGTASGAFLGAPLLLAGVAGRRRRRHRAVRSRAP
jgi:penicillin-binding protein 2